jgi:hypothetical protein
MDVSMLIGAMAFTTLLGAAAFAYYSKTKVDERMNDPDARKSTLASDQDSRARPADV